jgi:hypothetical protein
MPFFVPVDNKNRTRTSPGAYPNLVPMSVSNLQKDLALFILPKKAGGLC